MSRYDDDDFKIILKIILVILLFIFILVTGIIFLRITTGIPIEYSTGERTGIVYKISHSGILWKTYDGEMNLGGISKNKDNVSVNTWAFSVKDPALVTKITTACEQGEIITIQYKEPYLMTYRNGKTKCLVTGIKEKVNK